jgi:hypothetical protein
MYLWCEKQQPFLNRLKVKNNGNRRDLELFSLHILAETMYDSYYSRVSIFVVTVWCTESMHHHFFNEPILVLLEPLSVHRLSLVRVVRTVYRSFLGQLFLETYYL